ncbi:hypothetical protein LSH36_161g05025 [Paralvinella palmiformis]|uniref:Uncharacterized protein n=1 Tax=Paralvinella palmiformis TaxID=53620 RepID=A0AAD9JTP5_9ANNE|nr:hypothetical protein LSH36_161g05025 [Paralvinella palmiformis]
MLTLKTGLEGRVLLLYNEPIRVDVIEAINVRLVKEKPILIQIWQMEGDWTYSLKWQQELPLGRQLTYMDRMNYTMNVAELFGPIKIHHRLGIYTIEDPISIPVMIAADNRSRTILSPPADPLPTMMTPGRTRIRFSQLTFPYYIPDQYLRLCSELDCGLNINSSYAAEPSKQTLSTAGLATDTFLLNVPFLTGVLAWLVIVTVLLLVVLCIVSCFVFGKKKNDEQEESSDTRYPGEWFVVTDDPLPSLTLNTSHSSSAAICPSRRSQSFNDF